MQNMCVLKCDIFLKGKFTQENATEFTASMSGSFKIKISTDEPDSLTKIKINEKCDIFAHKLLDKFIENYPEKLIIFVGNYDIKTICQKWDENNISIVWNYNENKYNTILVVCDQLLNFKNIPENILNIMPGYQSFKSIGIQFDNIYNNRQDCSPSRASFASSQLNINIGDNIDQSWQSNYNPQLNTKFDTIGKSLSRNGFETVWYGKNHFVSKIATDENTTPSFNTNSRGCLRDYGYDIFCTYGDTYYYNNAGMFVDNNIFECKINNKNPNVDYIDSSGKYIGIIPYLKSNINKKTPFHLEMHLENPHDTQHFWQNLAEKPTKTQLQFWAPYINEQIELLQKLYPDKDISNPYNYSSTFEDAWIQNTNLVKNFFEKTFFEYMTNVDSLPFKESYLNDYILSTTSNNSQFPLYIGMMQSLQKDTTIPTSQDDIMSWKNLINNYYGLLLEADNYIYKLFKFLKENNMLKNTSVAIISDHGDLMSSHGLKQKGQPYENGTNIACLVYSPHIPKCLRGTTSNILGSLLDIAPTIEQLANIKLPSNFFLGKSLLNWKDKCLVPRNIDIPVFHSYYSWMTYLTYFFYKEWYFKNINNNTVLPDFNPSTFYQYHGFYNMTVENINGNKYKFVRYFNLIELLAYNWVFDPKLSKLEITADILKENFSKTLSTIDILKFDIFLSYKIIDKFFESNTWNFQNFWSFVLNESGSVDKVENIMIFISLINITVSNLGFSLIIPGYYNDTYTVFNNFLEYYNDPDNNYYFFLYDLTSDPNEITNLLDKGYPERQTVDVINTASKMNDDMNKQIDKYKIVRFDYIIPIPILESLVIKLKVNKNNVTVNSNSYFECFGQVRQDGDTKTQSYFNEIIDLLNKIV